mgnify:CR=1
MVSGREVGLGLAQALVKQLLNPFQAVILRKQLKVKLKKYRKTSKRSPWAFFSF